MNPFGENEKEPLAFDGQLDLFGFVANNKEPETKAPSPDCSQNGLVHFKYNPLLKKSIRCKGGFLFGHPEVLLPAYMKAPEFAAARELAAEWAEHAVRRKTQKNKAIIKDLVNRFWQTVDQIFTDKGETPLASKGRLPPIRPQLIARCTPLRESFTTSACISLFLSKNVEDAALCTAESSASAKNAISIMMNGSSGTRKSCHEISAP